MAFTLLCDEELSLLNDGQRMQYERQLKLYQQRVAFVERIEDLQNIQIEPYVPQLEPICVIDPIHVKSVKKQKYSIAICEPIKTPNLQVKSYQKVEQITPALPTMPKRVDVHTAHVQKPQIKTTALPEFAKSREVNTLFVCPKIEERNLPTVTMPKLEMRPIAVPAKTQPNLPDIPGYAANVRAFVKPQTYHPELPVFVKPEVIAGSYKEIKPIQLSLPDVSTGINWDKAGFVKPEQKNIDLPRMETPVVNVRSMQKVGRIVPNLPEVKIADIYHKDIKKPECVLLELPDVVEPLLPDIPVKKDIRANVMVSELPKVDIRCAPNACAILGHLLPASDKIRKI